jgi:hypothetical protein
VIVMTGGVEAERGKVVGDPVGAGLCQLGVGGCSTQGEDAAARGFGGADPGRCVFHDDAVGGREAESLCGFDIGLGIGFAALYVGGGDHVFRHGEAGGVNADLGQSACARCGDRPAILREGLQEFESAREGNYAFGVFDFAALDFTIFGFVVGVGEEFTDGGDARTAVGLADDLVGDEAVLVGPDGPDAGYGGSGVDEDAVEIEEHSTALNFHGLNNTWYSARSVGRRRIKLLNTSLEVLLAQLKGAGTSG